MPGLRLTPLQFCRLFGMSPFRANEVIAALVEDDFLRRTSTGAYCKADTLP
jgi:hypothetical protein